MTILRKALCALPAALLWLSAQAHGAEQQHATTPRFVASTEKPFADLMHDAMAVMGENMQRAPMSGVAEQDFVNMMIPHHQGAIDMAKAVLLYSNDAAMRNIAQGIITEQENEIRVMRAWLARQHKPASKAGRQP